MSEDKITLKIDSLDILTEYWISEGKRIATERIIKLLEDAMCSNKYDNPDNGDCMGYCYHCEWRTEIIKLIKGENK